LKKTDVRVFFQTGWGEPLFEKKGGGQNVTGSSSARSRKGPRVFAGNKKRGGGKNKTLGSKL